MRGDEYHRLRTAFLRLRAALRDPNTNLFSYSLFLDEIRGLLSERSRIGVLWVSLGDRRLVETVYGWEAYDRLLAHAAAFLAGSRTKELPVGTIVATAGVHADTFTLFVPTDHEGREPDAASLTAMATRVEQGLEENLVKASAPRMPGPSGVRVGAALLTDNPFQRFERRLYLALDEARSLAERPRDSERLAWLAELQRVLRERDLHCVFQTVVDLQSGSVQGLEAYARGPDGSVFHLPRVMFSLGREAGLAGDLDRLCRRVALESLASGGEAPPELLFLNTTVENLLDPEWRSGETFEALGRAGLEPAKVVLEVPEGQIAGDPDLYREGIDSLRGLGYRLSLDDIGSGPRSVTLVERLRPEFVKFDLTLVRGLGQDQFRRELVRSLVRLAERAEARLVAERVETDDERRALLDCGARWGQGYLFSAERPCPGMTPSAQGRVAPYER